MKELKDLKEDLQATQEKIRIRLQLIGSSKNRTEEVLFYKGQNKLAHLLSNKLDTLLMGTDEVLQAFHLQFPSHLLQERKKKRTVKRNKHKTVKRTRLDVDKETLHAQQRYQKYWEKTQTEKVESSDSEVEERVEDDHTFDNAEGGYPDSEVEEGVEDDHTFDNAEGGYLSGDVTIEDSEENTEDITENTRDQGDYEPCQHTEINNTLQEDLELSESSSSSQATLSSDSSSSDSSDSSDGSDSSDSE